MDITILQQLADLMESKNLSCLAIEENDCTIKMERQVHAPYAAPIPIAAPASLPTVPVTSPAEPAPAAAMGDELTSPIVGIGYMASSPGAAPFVSVGSKVKQGQTLCIIEAMKVMNEFNAPRDGEISDICFEDGQLVEFGQCLFRIV